MQFDSVTMVGMVQERRFSTTAYLDYVCPVFAASISSGIVFARKHPRQTLGERERPRMNHLQVLSSLLNGFLIREEQSSLLRWTTCFAQTSISNKEQHMICKYRTEKCSVCAFVNRCRVIQTGLGKKVWALDNALHKVGVYLPVNWTVICILGGMLMDAYTSTVDMQLDAWLIQPGDIVHHYMISSDCLYDRDGPMVALRDACAYLNDHVRVNDEEETEAEDLMDQDDEWFETDGATEEESREDKKKRPELQKQAEGLIDGIISMINRSDVLPGKCENMSYLIPADKALSDVMRIPQSVMLGEIISDPDDANMNQQLTEDHDHLYDIYKDLTPFRGGDNYSERDGTEMGVEPINRAADKTWTLMLGTYEWMKALAGTNK